MEPRSSTSSNSFGLCNNVERNVHTPSSIKGPLSYYYQYYYSDSMANEAQSRSNNNGKIQIRKILLPIDGSEYSINAAKYATRIAKDENAELFCIHVVSPRIPYGYETSAVSTKGQYNEDIKNMVELWFEKVRDIANNEGISDVKTDIFIDVKSIIESIIDYATSRDIDLIVIGTKGRTGLKRFLMGSVANGVVQHAHCPVLLVR